MPPHVWPQSIIGMFCTVSRQLSPLQAVSPTTGYRKEEETLALRPGWRSFRGIGLYTRAGGIWRNCRHGLRAGFEERRGSRCIVQYHKLQTGSANDAHESLYPGLVPWYQYASWGSHRRSAQAFNCTSSKGAEYKCKRIKPMPETATRGPEALKKPNSQIGIKRTSS